MYVDELVEVFEKAVSSIPQLSGGDVLISLKASIEEKKYDLQDQGLIEAILREDRHELVQSLMEGLEEVDFSKNGDEIKKEAIEIFIASLEHLINYYYNNVIGKHFSST